jgi:hypothetical protein
MPILLPENEINYQDIESTWCPKMVLKVSIEIMPAEQARRSKEKAK